MKQVVVLVAGFVAGVALAIASSACSSFECRTIDHPLLAGKYASPGNQYYTLEFELDGTAVETYSTSFGETRAEYTVGPVVTLH